MLAIYLAAAALACAVASPAPGRVLFDQSQEGEINVRADLENFVILVIPASSNTGLLDLLSKTVPLKSLKRRKHVKHEDPETQNFIESKTAPYHVDITKSKNNLAKLHPDVEKNEELLIARSPSVALNKLHEGRSQKMIRDRVFVSLSEATGDGNAKGRSYGNDVQEVKIGKDKLLLLGAVNEQCGPGQYRDAEGICRIIKE